MKKLKTKFKLNWMERRFCKAFLKTIEKLSKEDRAQADDRLVEMLQAEQDHITDRVSQSHIIMSSLVLIGYELLCQKGLTQKESTQILAEKLQGFGKNFIIWPMRIMLWLGLYNRKYLESKSKQTVQERYGDTFTVGEEKKEGSYVITIKKCGYHDFFSRHQEPALTGIFCAWDALWADEINRSNRGIRFNRPTTLAKHKESCRFEFHFEENERITQINRP